MEGIVPEYSSDYHLVGEEENSPSVHPVLVPEPIVEFTGVPSESAEAASLSERHLSLVDTVPEVGEQENV